MDDGALEEMVVLEVEGNTSCSGCAMMVLDDDESFGFTLVVMVKAVLVEFTAPLL